MADITDVQALIAPSFLTKNGLTGAALTTAQCIKITRTDAVVMGFTTHDRDIVIDGVTYKAKGAFARLSSQETADLGVDNQKPGGYLDDDGIRDDDIVGGKYSGATIESAEIDWSNPPTTLTDGVKHVSRTIARISLSDSSYQIELVGDIENTLRTSITKVTQATCSHRLGHGKCTVDLASISSNTDLATVTSNSKMSVSDNSFVGEDLAYGEITFTAGLNVGISRDIYTADGSTITLTQGLPYIPQVGDNCTVVRGCSKAFEYCRDEFDNIDDFDGVPSHGNFAPGNDRYFNPEEDD